MRYPRFLSILCLLFRVVLVPASAAPPSAALELLDDRWSFTAGAEFPGASGMLSSAPATGDAGRVLTGDFSGGGRYVGMTFTPTSPLALESLTLRIKTSLPSLALRVTDDTGQVFQQYLKPAPAASPDDWREIVVREFSNPTNKGIFFWGGKKDGVWSGRVRSLTLLLNNPGDPGPHEIAFAAINAGVRPEPPALVPVGAPLAFYLEPGIATTVSWKPSGPVAGFDFAYTLLDYEERPVGGGVARPASNAPGLLQAVVNLRAGYHEIVFPKAGGQRFGFIVQPAFKGTRDPYFGIDAAFGYFPVGKNPELRRSYLDVLVRCGIGMQRERLGLSLAQLEKGEFVWSAHAKELRAEARERGIHILENFCPVEQRRPNPYPANLFGIAQSWAGLLAGMDSESGGVELWNEPDIFAGGQMPGDIYMALLRAADYRQGPRKSRTPLAGGVFNHIPGPAFDTYAINGYFDATDVFTYHDYYAAGKTEALIAQYRKWAAEHGHPGIPFWMTEAGSPWKTGPARPPANEAAAGALHHAAKAVETRACGVERYYAFLFGYFDENTNNWGMHGRENTPLRGMAAYAAAVRLLSGTRYVGDLSIDDRALAGARVFADEATGRAVVVLRAEVPGKAVAWRAAPASAAIFGLDGRILGRAPDGGVPLTDGLAYVETTSADLTGRIDRDTVAARLTAQAASPAAPRAPASPLVFMPEPDAAALAYSPKGYAPKDPMDARMTARLFNLSAVRLDYAYRLELPHGVRLVRGASAPTGSVDGGGSVDLDWSFDFSAAATAKKEPLDIIVREVAGGVARWTMRFLPAVSGVAMPVAAGEVLSAGMTPDPRVWRELGAEDYVPLGFVIHDGKSRVWARCSWSPEFFRVDALVEKAEFHQDYANDETWLGDSIQIGLQGPDSKMTAVELAAAFTKTGPQLYRHAGGPRGLLDSRQVDVRRSGTRTLYSLVLPVAEVGLPKLSAGMTLKFSLLANCSDGRSRSGYFRWGDGIAGIKTTSEYVLLKLVETP